MIDAPGLAADVARIKRIEQLESLLVEANEYARKLSIKVTEQGVEIQRLQATLQRKQDAGDLLFEELDDITPEENCECIPHGWKCASCLFNDARAAIKAWKEANK